MPNWCYTSIRIEGEPEVIKPLYNEFSTATSSNALKADFGNTWLGNLLLHIGLTEEEVLSGNIRCRGSITGMDLCPLGDEINIYTETAWVPMIDCISVFADYYTNGNYSLIYTAEEPGCGIFITNDPDFTGTWILENYDEEGLEGIPSGSCDYYSDDELNNLLSRALNMVGTTEELMEKLTLNHTGVWGSRFEYDNSYLNHNLVIQNGGNN